MSATLIVLTYRQKLWFTVAWLLLLAIIALQPSRPAPMHIAHRELHFLAFAITALLIPRKPLQSLTLTVAFGVTLEFLQHLIYHNPMEWWDVRDDAIGATAAIILLWGISVLRASAIRKTT